MSAQEKQEEFLPKEPKDLPTPPLDLPAPHSENSSHAQVRTLLSWHAPGRPFRKRTKQYYLTALLIMLLVQIILFLFSQYILMIVVLSLVFVSFVLASVPPHDFHYRISSEGITVEDHFFLWQELYDFYFKKVEGSDVLHIRTKAFIPGILIISLGEIDVEHAKAVVLPYLPYREFVKPTFMESSGEWLSRNFPLEATS
ncbi:MAG: hypothetical protein AAB675_04295 [Patescibacteria group bacterium]